MEDQEKTKEQLINELSELRQRIAELETSEAERKRLDEALHSVQQKLQAIFNAIQEIMNVVDLDFNLIDVNDVLIKVFGLPGKESVIGYKCFEVLKGRKDICPNCVVAEAYRTKAAAYRTSTPEDEGATKGRSFEIFAYPIIDERGNLSGAVEFARDITERKRAEEALQEAYDKLEMRVKERTAELAKVNEELRLEIAERKRAEETISQLAYHDSLTGLPNRLLFNERLILEMAHAERNQQKLAVILLDLDNFKDINDSLGHNVGDQLLKMVGDRLARLLRKADTIARMGGDEFMLLLPKIIRAEYSVEIAHKIQQTFQEPFVFDGQKIRTTASIGIAIYPDDGGDIDTLIKNADIAMYRVKEQGRNKYFRYR
jgi:diguanylate cyclase (GGDEF)-like protein/PAS domain S-box-containing protein